MPSAWLSDLTAPFHWFVTWGGEATYDVSRWVFLRLAGLAALIAFASFWIQLPGLIGSRGVLPAREFLERLRDRLAGRRWLRLPTLCWLGADDRVLHAICAAGVAASLLVVTGVGQAPALLAIWLLYLSLVSVSRDFLAFQWDVLLLETALLAALVAPWDGGAGTSPVALLLLWWLLFRLMFQSGVVKLTSGDPAWRDLTALRYHWWTQPLPTWPAWWMHQLPRGAHRLVTAGALVLELVFPLLIFGPPAARVVACAGIILFQVGIAATGNYTFFNLLTIVLALLLVPDTLWQALGVPVDVAVSGSVPPVQSVVALLLAVPFIVFGTVRLWQSFATRHHVPGWLRRALGWIEPFRTINGYGLFRVMTTSRPEVEVQGSVDGERWETYRFRWKPGDPTRRPRFVAPHQPRLDWQLWFAALAGYRRTAWVPAFLARLLAGEPMVLRLLADDPFDGRPPRYVRTRLWAYTFTTWSERRRTGAWWSRELLGPYGPVLERGEA